jgi:hypothetical protein
MSDFLSNLVTRSLEAAPVIQPRLPSLFEPAKPYIGSFDEASPAGDEVVREAGVESAFKNVDGPSIPREGQAPVTKAQALGSVSPESPLPVARTFHAEESKRGPAGKRQSDVSPQATSETPRQSAPAVRPHAVQTPPDKKPMRLPMPTYEASSDVHPPPVPSVSAPKRNAAISDLVAPAVLPKSAAFVPDQSTAEQSAARREIPERGTRNSAPPKIDTPREFHVTAKSHVQSPLVEPAQSRNEDSAPRVPAAIAPASAPHFDFARHIPPAPQVSPPEPIIQVTIGRIEVRAVSSQAAAPKQRPASPVMSLDDYLRSRRGGA